MKAIIAGAGIGGLTAALCLQRIGWQVEVIEQASQLDEVGAGIQISPNASRVLDKLGVLSHLGDQVFHPEKIEMRIGRTSRPVFSIPLRKIAVQRWGAAYLHLHRADLINALSQTLNDKSPDSLIQGVAVQSYTSTEEGVRVKLSDGSQRSADLLVGADGIHSVVRKQMLGDDAPRFTGNAAWRATVPVDRLGEHVPPPTACIWTGRGRHAVTYLLRGGTVANFVGVIERSDWQSESWTQQGSREEALADFADWHPVITTIIEQTDSHYRWALYDRAPLKQWTDGRVVLLGDACHPMLPFLAQGAAMAIEDGWVLADQLQNQTNTVEALTRYAQIRQPRTARVQNESRANMKRFHMFDTAYAPLKLAARLKPDALHARQDWLYGHDVTI